MPSLSEGSPGVYQQLLPFDKSRKHTLFDRAEILVIDYGLKNCYHEQEAKKIGLCLFPRIKGE